MRRLVAVVLVCSWLLFGSAWAAAFPSVPDDAALYPVQHFYDVALLYSWAEGGEVYVHFKLITEKFFACSKGFRIQQNGVDLTNLSLQGEYGQEFCETFTADRTLRLRDPYLRLNANQDFTLFFSANATYELNVKALLAQGVGPANGIWKDASNTLSFYLQTYQNGSAAIAVTTDGIDNVLFLDPDYSDGIWVVNDLGNQGYTWQLILQDRTKGTVIAKLPCGVQIREVSLVFPATK